MINDAIEAVTWWDTKFKKKLARISRSARRFYFDRGIWPLYASYGLLKGVIADKTTAINALLINIPVDIQFLGNQVVLIKKDVKPVINERLYVFLMREYENPLQLHEFEPKDNLLDIKNDLEKIIKQEILINYTNPLSFPSKEHDNHEIVTDITHGVNFDKKELKNLTINHQARLALVELTGGKLKKDYQQILEKGENNPFESIVVQKSNEYYQNQVINNQSGLVDITPTNIFQKYAINSALNENTVIIGPPGTGKSEVIANLIANIVLLKKNAIVVSEKQAAMDVIFSRIGKINELVLWMHNFHEKERFYKKIVAIEAVFGQYYRSDFQSLVTDRSENLLQNKIDRFTKQCDAFLQLTKNEIELAKALDCYDQSYVQYLKKQNNQIQTTEQIAISSYLILPNQNAVYELYNQLQQYLSKISGDNQIFETFRQWYWKNREVFEEANFDLFIEKTWKQYLNFKSFIKNYEDLLNIFPNLLENLLCLDYESQRSHTISWLRLSKRRFLHVVAKLHEFASFLKRPPLVFLKTKLPPALKKSYLSHYNKLQNFIESLMTFKNIDWNKYQKLETCTLTTFQWETIIKNNWWMHWFEKNPLMTQNNQYLFQDAIQTIHSHTKDFANNNDYLIVKEFLEYKKHELRYLPKNELEEMQEMFKMASKVKKPPVTSFIRKYYKSLKQIFPIWILNPEGVAEYVPCNRKEFDYGIFDKASQMFLERGFPIVYRCTTNVVAGDMNQLKPTSFFTSRFDESTFDSQSDNINLDDENKVVEFDENEDVESLLERATNERWNIFNLKNHYRSISKQLIEFSNQNIYNNDLHIATLNGNWNKAIDVINVDGQWKKNSNEMEAKIVIDKIKENLESYNSILAIAFNVKQADLIDDLLADEPISEDNRKKISVSNLENVQGTEADLVIISVTYGPNENGEVRANFGPLNQTGGRNRLNVIITRGKQKMIVIKSFKASDVENKILSEDAKIFINWIRYLDNIGQRETSDLAVFSNNDLQKFDHNFAKTVYQAIVDLKIDADIYVKTQLPVGNKVIDIGIMDEKTKKCILGVVVEQWNSEPNIKHQLEQYDYQGFLKARNYQIFRIKQYEWLLMKDRILASLQQQITNNVLSETY